MTNMATERLNPDVERVVTRRTFLEASLGFSGALLVGFHVPSADAAAATGEKAVFAPNAFIRIDAKGKITLIMPQVEMGQGIYTAIAMILAEELDAAFEQVVVEAAPPNDKLYANPTFGLQVTGNSNSIRAFWMPLRKAAAGARAMLVQAAAQFWKVEPASIRTDSSTAIHDTSGRRLSYAALIERTNGLTAPQTPTLKDPKDFKLIGKPLKRLDTPDKVNGKVVYSIDVMPPGVKFATIAACPVFGGKVGTVDDTKAKSLPGVRQVVVLDDLVAVIGDHMWAAKQGLAALNVTWNEGANAAISSADVWKQIRAASLQEGAVAKTQGDAAKGLSAGELHEAVYEVPFLAHATLEPLNCTVHVTPTSCEIWVGIQVLSRAQAAAAKVTGLPLDKVTVNNQLIGGGFGRRLETDFIEKAVRIAKQVDGPVKVVYTREEDIQHDIYRPVYLDRISASLSNGRIVGWKHRITGSAVIARWLPPAFQKGIDIDAIDSAADIPYDIPNLRVEYVRDEPPAVPTGFWRGVGPNNNVFAIETFIDELAKKSNKDPVAFRRDHLDKEPRLRAALDLAAEKAGWGSPLPARTGRGVGVQVAFGSFIATVTQAQVDEHGQIRLQRIVMAVDTGITVNPDTVIAQLQGGMVFGLTAALYGDISIKKGRVQQSNFHDYRMLRINEVPQIEVHIIKSGEPPGGIGEAGTTAAAAALGNALFAATGVRLRRLPIDRDVLSGRKPA
jgi:isoquinoline 1-oxidoreductase beta subunit